MSEYATVQRDGFTVPLIGIPKDATMDKCGGCGELKHISDLEFDPCAKLLCPKCRQLQKRFRDSQ